MSILVHLPVFPFSRVHEQMQSARHGLKTAARALNGKQIKLRPPLLLTVGLQVSYLMSRLLSFLFALTPTCLLWENKVTPLKTLGKFLFLGGGGGTQL